MYFHDSKFRKLYCDILESIAPLFYPEGSNYTCSNGKWLNSFPQFAALLISPVSPICLWGKLQLGVHHDWEWEEEEAQFVRFDFFYFTFAIRMSSIWFCFFSAVIYWLTETASTSTRRARNMTNEKFELQTWSELPKDLLEVMVSRLSLHDNIRTSGVCKSSVYSSKRWHLAANAMRVVNRPPLLMFCSRDGEKFKFYDPSQRRIQPVKFPQLVYSKVCCSKDGWLLLYNPTYIRAFFFNPFTQDEVKLPTYDLDHQIVAFSAPPTFTSCIVFTIKHVSSTSVNISTCRPGAKEMTTVQYQNRLPFVSSIWNKLVFCNDLFYCQSLTGWVGVFNPHERTWTVLSVPPPKCPDRFLAKNWWKGNFLSEKHGSILVIYTCSTENPIAFKLDEKNMVWEQLGNLDGATVFASFLTTLTNVNLPAIKRNSIYFSKIRFYGRHCISYSLEDGRCHPRNEYHDWGELEPYETIWIEPPESFAGLN
ncbi:LOW QUALITY PROTEIN: F-box/kelch-repeat protein At1g57790-like [Argentina anserina]|uniref:LOW QUALITY PROTEIN: F-box/kelch-repeat protein At1g57790-like n=1 Tax=Argentina anserina TaxID=57926 RepID=UPI0021767BFF|nr:LOW QUALITY PROTEIN: F-box/kelch-repeat protein At1g57790-like [Potentilla anserina]